MNQNQFEKTVTQAALWVRTHQERFWAVTGASVLSILLIALIVHHRQTESEEAWFQLGNIQGQLMQGKTDDTRKALESWQARFQGSDAEAYAKFMKADLLYRTSDYVQATQVYNDIVQTGRPDLLKPLALSAEISTEEMAGHYPQALTLAKTFLDKYPDHFLGASAYLSQARVLELTGDKAGAAAVYDRFILLFPQSPWTALARTRTQALTGTVPTPTAPSLPLSPEQFSKP